MSEVHDDNGHERAARPARADGQATEEARRHEAHLVGQIYHLIEANHRLEEQLHRLGKVTEIADLFREKRITRDTFELRPPKLLVPVQAETAWNHIDKMLSRLDADLAESEAGLGGLQGGLHAMGDALTRVEQGIAAAAATFEAEAAAAAARADAATTAAEAAQAVETARAAEAAQAARPDAGAGEDESGESRSTESKAAESKSTESKSAESNSAESKSTDARAGGSEPSGAVSIGPGTDPMVEASGARGLSERLSEQGSQTDDLRALLADQGAAASGLRDHLAGLASVMGGLRSSLVELRDGLGVVRESAWSVDPDWLSDVRGRLVAAEQAIAFLNEQSRELDMLRREKDSIMDGATRLEQNMEDLWKALNEKTTHIQRLEAQLTKVWASLPYRAYRFLTRPFRSGSGS